MSPRQNIVFQLDNCRRIVHLIQVDKPQMKIYQSRYFSSMNASMENYFQLGDKHCTDFRFLLKRNLVTNKEVAFLTLINLII